MSNLIPNLRLSEVRRFPAMERKYYDLEGRIEAKLKWMLNEKCDVVIDKEGKCAHCYLRSVPDGIEIPLDSLVRIRSKAKLIEFWERMKKKSISKDLTEFSRDRICDLAQKENNDEG